MSKYLLTSLLGLAVAAFAATGAQAAVHGMFGNGYSANDGAYQAQQSYRSSKRAVKRSGKRYKAQARGKKRYHARRSGKRKSASLKSRSITRASRSAGTSRTCLQASARALLNRIESQFGAVQIVSTCRPGAVIAGSGKPSKHRYGLAIDFNAPAGKKGAIVQWLIKNHRSGGTMTYAGMNHIHVDVGPRFVSLGAGGRRRG